MWLDGDLANQPPNTCRENYNINNYNKIGSVTNEISNKIITEYNTKTLFTLPLKDDEFIIFSQNGKIGLVSNNVYTLKYTFSFAENEIIQGTFYINDLSERIVVFRCESLGIKQINIDNVNSDNDFFNTSQEPIISTEIVKGGNLEVGGYNIFCRYIKKDKSTTNYFKSYNSFIIESKDNRKSGTQSNRAIKLSISNINLNYKYIEIGFVRTKEGNKEAFIVKKLPILSTTTSVTIGGGEILIPISLTELIENKAIYKNINYLKVVKNYLYGLGTKEYKEKENLQSLVNNLNFSWYSELVGEANVRNSDIDLNLKTFSHGEVYAFYIRFKYKWGVSKWYICKGRNSISSELENVTIETRTDKRYLLEDTCSLTGDSGTGKKGVFSFWENEEEEYPIEGGFPTGKVKHFKFPSINWMRKNVYNNTAYGSSLLDKLGIIIENINLSTFTDFDGNVPYIYELGYAKRTQSNSLNLGQSIVVFSETNQSVGLDTIHANKRYSTGGNFRNNTGGSIADILYRREYRTYPLEVLNNLGTSYLDAFREEVKLTVPTVRFNTDSINNPLHDTFKFTHILSEFSHSGSESAAITQGYKPNINKSQIILNNTLKDDIDNTFLETCYSIQYNTDLETLTDSNTSTAASNKVINNVDSITAGNETTKLITLLSGLKNCYSSFYNQEIISLGSASSNKFTEGDTFINKLSIVLYGAYRQAKRVNKEKSEENDEQGIYEGNVAIKTFLCESVYNGNSLIDDTVKHFPNFDFTSTKLYHATRRRDLDPNLFNVSVNKDYGVLNELEFSKVFIYDDVNYIDDDYKIIRSGNALNNAFYNFREFSRDDFALITRTKGKPISLHEEKDFIYIQCENSLFKTVTSERAAVDNTDNLLYVKVGDIFEYPFFEVSHSEFGELGCKYVHGSGVTKYGYVIIDVGRKQIYLINNGIEVISQNGLIGKFNSILSSEFGTNPFTEKAISFVADYRFERITFLLGNYSITYSVASKGWTHFNTIIPQIYFRTRDKLFSLYNNQIYLHNENKDYNCLYGEKIQGVYKPVIQTRDKSNSPFPVNGFRFKPSFLDLIKFSNSYQSTRYLNLKLMDNQSTLQNTSGNVRKYKNDFLYYHIRDSQTTDLLVDTVVVAEIVLRDSSMQEISEIDVMI